MPIFGNRKKKTPAPEPVNSTEVQEAARQKALEEARAEGDAASASKSAMSDEELRKKQVEELRAISVESGKTIVAALDACATALSNFDAFRNDAENTELVLRKLKHIQELIGGQSTDLDIAQLDRSLLDGINISLANILARGERFEWEDALDVVLDAVNARVSDENNVYAAVVKLSILALVGQNCLDSFLINTMTRKRDALREEMRAFAEREKIDLARPETWTTDTQNSFLKRRMHLLKGYKANIDISDQRIAGNLATIADMERQLNLQAAAVGEMTIEQSTLIQSIIETGAEQLLQRSNGLMESIEQTERNIAREYAIIEEHETRMMQHTTIIDTATKNIAMAEFGKQTQTQTQTQLDEAAQTAAQPILNEY